MRYLILALLVSCGCGTTWQQASRKTLGAVALGVTASSEALASEIRLHCRRPGLGSEAVMQCVRASRYDVALSALIIVDSSSAAMDQAIEVATSATSPTPSVLRAGACLIAALSEAQAAFVAAGVELPQELRAVVSVVSAVAGEECTQ